MASTTALEETGCLPPLRVKVGITFADGTQVQEALNTFFQVIASDTDSQVIVLRCLAHMLKQTMPSLPGSRLQDAMELFQKLRALQTLARTGLGEMMAQVAAAEEAEGSKAACMPETEVRRMTEPHLPDLEEDREFKRAVSDEAETPGRQRPRPCDEVAALAELYRSNRSPLKFSNKQISGSDVGDGVQPTVTALTDLKGRRISQSRTTSTLGSMPTISELPELQCRTGTEDTEEVPSEASSCRGDDDCVEEEEEELGGGAHDTFRMETEGSEFAEVPDDVALPEAPRGAGVVFATPGRKVGRR